MPDKEFFSPNEPILFKGILFAKACDPFNVFTLSLRVEQKFADEKEMPIKMISAAFYVNIINGFLTALQVDHKSILLIIPIRFEIGFRLIGLKTHMNIC